MFNFNINLVKKTIKDRKRFIKIVVIFAFVFSIYFAFGIHHITEFNTADEGWWLYKRIPQYWNSIEAGNLEGTMINDKPGVSLALITAPGYYLKKKSINDSVTLRPDYPYKRVEQQDVNIKKNLFALRFSVLLFNGIFSLFLFWLIKKLTGNFWIAFWSFALILLSPVMVGISQIINPDSAIWLFSTGALLSYLLFMKEGKKKYVAWSALCLGFALLSKYSTTILFPFFSLLSFAYIAYKIPEWKDKANFLPKIRRILIGCLSIFLGSVITFAFFMPAVFRIKNLLWQSTVGYPGLGYFFWPLVGIQLLILADVTFLKGRILLFFSKTLNWLIKNFEKLAYLFLLCLFIITLSNWILEYDFFGIKNMRFDMGREFSKFIKLPFHEKMILEARPLVFSLTPIAIISILFFWFKSLFRKVKFNMLSFSCTIFLVIFYLAVIFEELVVTIRYSLILYPLVLILAALGIHAFLSLDKFKKIDKFVFSIVLIIIISSSLYLTKPYYFNYTNVLLPNKYMITGAWGYGGYEAAEYINSRPNPADIVTWADYPGVCEFTIGKCYQTRRIENSEIDYFVLTRRGKLKYEKRGNVTGAKDYYNDDDPKWSLEINGREGNYVKVFKNEKLEQ